MSTRLQTQAKAAPVPSFTPVRAGILQRACACGQHTQGKGECEECRKHLVGAPLPGARPLQRRVEGRAGSSQASNDVPPIVHDVLRSPGQPLDAATRAFFEPRFGHDFSQVRVHTDTKAADSARAVSALAYTVGRDVVFAAGQYSPGATAGRRLLAHELTHAVQQSRTGISYPAGSLRVSEPAGADEREAEVVAGRMMAADRYPAIPADIRLAGPAIQRLGNLSKVPPGVEPDCEIAGDSPTSTVETIKFANKVSALSGLQRAQIDNFVMNWRAGGANTPVRVDGYASTLGSDESNWKLSCDRAKAVVEELTLPTSGVPGIPSSFIKAVAQGETAEFGAEDENRRATISSIMTLPPKPPPPAPPVPPAPSPVTQHCTPSQTAKINTEFADARKWLDDAESKISAFNAGTASPAVAAVVSGALTSNFHTTAPADVATIAANFASLRKALNSALNFECASSFWCTATDLAYVRGAFGGISRLFDINICPLWFSCGNYFRRVPVFIHERAHQYPGATDNAYEWSPSYSTLSAADAIDNADSYAVAARQIFHGGAHGPGETC